MGGAITRTERRGAAIFGLLIAIFVVRFFVDTPGLSLVFLAIFPIVLAAFALGRNAALVCGALAAALSVVVPILSPGTDVSTHLRPGGGLLLFTDGLPEARTVRRDRARLLFGEHAARDTLRRLRGASPQEIVSALRSAAVDHAEGTPTDDLCLVAVRREPDRAAQPQAA